MLPFLMRRNLSPTVMVNATPEGEMEPEVSNEAMISAAEDILSAIAAKDATGLASALSAAFEIHMGSSDE